MPAIGIDLGTTYSCVAVSLPQKALEVIANEEGKFTTPSQVAFTDKETLVGAAAKNVLARNPKNTIYGIKRVIGRAFNDSVVQKQMKKWPFEIVGDQGKTKIKIREKGITKTIYPEEISAIILRYMKKIAEDYMNKDIHGAVITVPAYFDNSQRSATKDAADIAGLHVLGMINEPTAAAMAYGLQHNISTERHVLVYDLGGGTFDATVMTINDGLFDVKATIGDSQLGGEDFNDVLCDYITESFKNENEGSTQISEKAKHRVLRECEEVKRQISAPSCLATDVYVASILDELDLDMHITRAKFEKVNEELFDRTLKLVKQVLIDAKMTTEQIDDVVLVGGSTRIPYVQKMLHDHFGDKIRRSINPDEAVALGAAIHAAFLSGDAAVKIQRMVLRDVTPFSLGTDVDGDTMSFIIKKNSKIPTSGTESYVTSSDDQTSVRVEVYEGEEEKCSQNKKLACFVLDGIPPMPAGEAKIEVHFQLDESGILNVTATEKSAGVEKSISTAMESARMSPDELNRLKRQAENKRKEDDGWRTRNKALNDLETYVNTIRKKGEDLLQKCDSVQDWIEQNQTAPETDVAAKREELETQSKNL